jgi:hypothetical protein
MAEFSKCQVPKDLNDIHAITFCLVKHDVLLLIIVSLDNRSYAR